MNGSDASLPALATLWLKPLSFEALRKNGIPLFEPLRSVSHAYAFAKLPHLVRAESGESDSGLNARLLQSLNRGFLSTYYVLGTCGA